MMPTYHSKARTSLIAACLALCLQVSPGSVAQHTLPDNAEIREQAAYHLGTLAYTYGYPMVDMLKQMHNETHRIKPVQPRLAPVNHFYYFTDPLTPPNDFYLREPSSAMLYFGGWFDLSREPVVVHNPDTSGRYYTMAITDLNIELMHLGRRTIGTREQYHALVGPNWEGVIPDAIMPLPVRTHKVRILGRVLVKSPQDLPAAQKLIKQFWATPLSRWRRGKPPTPPQPASAPIIDPMNSLQFFYYMNRALRANPQKKAETALMSLFDSLGLGPFSEFNSDQLDPDVAKGLTRAIKEGGGIIDKASKLSNTPVNGWITSTQTGRYGFNYLQRASAVRRGGYGSLPEESLQSRSYFDDQIKRFKGSNRYQLVFPKGALPPVKEFWTLSAYRANDHRMEQNALRRYHIGNLTPGLNYSSDGSLTIHLQHAQPAAGPGNWLPIPAGDFYLIMRQYEPETALLEGEYQLPAVQRLN